MTRPITPDEVTALKEQNLPNAVFEVFNELIAAGWDGCSATVYQDDAASMIAALLDMTKGEVFRRGYLDVEPIYRKKGWVVKYDKPGYNETYPASFNFSKKKR